MVFNDQGRIVDGTNLVNGTLAVIIDRYDAETGGGCIYSETQTLSVLDGLYSLSIGASNNTPGSLLSALESDTVYLELTFDAMGLSPRSRIVSVPFAAVSRFAESLDTGDRALFSDPLRLTRSDSRISRGRTDPHSRGQAHPGGTDGGCGRRPAPHGRCARRRAGQPGRTIPG